ncbi:MAG: DUF6146 family protein [Cyclobacteriaceae bacterium]
MLSKFIIIAIFCFIIIGCAPARLHQPASSKIVKPEIEEAEQEEHKVIVLDPGFETWFVSRWSPAQDRSYQYYKGWNDQYVVAWNIKARQPRYAWFFENEIQYDANTDYGMEVARKLFYYFRWVESELNVPILDGRGPRSPI